ncbi:hypothetical protein IC235_10415 [Hymenobacter sp. BT664]|uniref:DUF4369 domain-containing protein n=1 Tax=Hymenobacter montanus TaxID=2771359 RepID=A0A927BCK4_9BACT|nr:hypothetical protein [Hymenobacter montanus]MBD2768306.1 hypothetical protein [Hymenobacter montanus]
MKSCIVKSAGRALVASCWALQLASCVSTEHEASIVKQEARAIYRPPVAGSRIRVNSRTVLNTVSIAHVFSNPKALDNFTLQLRGPRVLTGQAHFIVTNSAGDTLRHEVLPARALLGESASRDPLASSVRDREIAILQSMNSFFAAGNFSRPAIPTDAAPPTEVDSKIWSALSSDSTAVGFDYPSTGGAERRMAYVRKLRKTIVIDQ